MNTQNEDMLNFKVDSSFIGYDKLTCESKINGIFANGKLVDEASGKLVLTFDQTVFYATSGGQIGDSGIVSFEGNDFTVLDSFGLPNNQHAVLVDTGDIKLAVNDEVILNVDEELRNKSAANHSGTHLLNEALRKVLGTHVKQQGSSVTSESLRFDFNNFVLPTDEELLKVEELVNNEIEDFVNRKMDYLEQEREKDLEKFEQKVLEEVSNTPMPEQEIKITSELEDRLKVLEENVYKLMSGAFKQAAISNNKKNKQTFTNENQMVLFTEEEVKKLEVEEFNSRIY